MTIGTAVAFIYGMFLGSFLNVCIFRLPRGTSIVFPGSACPVCKTPIRWWQNIPILSYLFLTGRCASCGTTISLRYPIIEALCGLLTAFVWKQNSLFVSIGWSIGGLVLVKALIMFAKDLLFAYLLVVITMIDWDYQVILDATIYIGMAAGFIANALEHRFYESVLSCAAAMLLFYAIRVVGEFIFLKEAMGEGDMKLAGMLGAVLGSTGTVIAILFSFPIGILIASSLIILKIKGRKDYTPFGPAMCIAGFIAAFWGDKIIAWYILHFLPG